MPGILQETRQPNWPNKPFIVGAIKEQEVTFAACLGGGAERDAWG